MGTSRRGCWLFCEAQKCHRVDQIISNFALEGYRASAVPEPFVFVLVSLVVILLGGMSFVAR